MRPETFGIFAAKVAKYGTWRRRANLQKPAIGGHFFYYWGQILAAPDWLAGDAVLIAPVSTQIPW